MDMTTQTTGYQDPADEKNTLLSETAQAFWTDISTRQDSKGGKNFAGLRNFLATDEVPESIFGIPVVQDESGYTEKDLAFFRENPKAAGFYDLGDEEMEEEEDVPPVMDLFGGDAGAFRRAFEQKRKELVQATAEKQYGALLKFKDPTHRKRAESALYAALDEDARNAALLDEYDRVSEANRPKDKRSWKAYDALIEKGRGKYAGGAWDKMLAAITSPDWKPPAERKPEPVKQNNGFITQAKEAFGVAKDLVDLVSDGAKDSLDLDKIHAGAANLARPKSNTGIAEIDASMRNIPVIVNGKIDEGGKLRSMTDADRAGLDAYKKQIGLQEANKGGETTDALRTRQDAKGGDSLWGKLKRRIGETGEVLDYGIAWMERQAKQTADMDVPVLSKFADAVVQPALVGTRAAIANATSGGGKYYRPEVRDERYFSQASLQQLGQAVRKHGGKGTRRDDFDIGTAGGFGVANTVGGSKVVDGKLTDKFDVDAHDPYGMTTVKVVGKPIELLHRALGSVVGSGDDPDAGKIKTSIPLTALDLRLDAKGGEAAKDVRGLLRTFKNHVKTHEDRKVEPYKDVDGNWAIGYGSHFLADGTPVTRNTAATDKMIDDAFEKDLERRLDLLAGHDKKQSRYAIPNWRHMSPASKFMLLDVAWGRKTTLTKAKSPGLFKELEDAGDDTAALDDAVKRHYMSYRKARDSKGVVDESLTEGLQNRRIALLKALTGEDFSYEGKKWDAKQNRFVEE